MALEKLNKTFKNKGEWKAGDPVWNADLGEWIRININGLIDSQTLNYENMKNIADGTDANSLIEPGIYRCALSNLNGTILNYPKTSYSTIMFVLKVSSTVLLQIVIASEGNEFYMRRYLNSNWKNWYQYASSQSWVAPVSGFEYRKVGNMVDMRVLYSVSNTLNNGAWLTLHTLPTEYRPKSTIAFSCILRNADNSQYVLGLCHILTDGTVRICQRTGTNVNINNVNFSITYSLN